MTELDSPYDTLDQIDVLLIGKTGNGKSALGNKLLGHVAFESKPSLSSVTIDATYDVSETNGFRIKVVDGPGVGDTRMSSTEGMQELLSVMSKAIALSPNGYHAFLLVVRFGGRFTAEDRDTVVTLKKIFGENFFKKFCILVMTCGDKFEQEVKKDFKQWVDEQANVIFAEMVKECNNRIVLFDNKTQDTDKQKRQLGNLLSIIGTLRKLNCRYSDEHFNAALTSRNILLAEAEKNIIEEEIMDESCVILHRLDHILTNTSPEIRIPLLNDMLERVNLLFSTIKQKDNGTGVLNLLSQHVWSVIISIRDQITVSESFIHEKEKYERNLKELTASHDEALKRQRVQFNQSVQEERDQSKQLQQQIDKLTKKKEKIRQRKESLESKHAQELNEEPLKLKQTGENVQQIKNEQVRCTEENVSKNIFARLLKHIFSPTLEK
ncbi:Immune-associated nucleotide-binding protein 9 [Bulinus truncatus]|nr:Immune-associated nucleotide-binding protein 9 [Bulinus truncatus]